MDADGKQDALNNLRLQVNGFYADEVTGVVQWNRELAAKRLKDNGTPQEQIDEALEGFESETSAFSIHQRKLVEGVTDAEMSDEGFDALLRIRIADGEGVDPDVEDLVALADAFPDTKILAENVNDAGFMKFLEEVNPKTRGLEDSIRDAVIDHSVRFGNEVPDPATAKADSASRRQTLKDNPESEGDLMRLWFNQAKDNPVVREKLMTQYIENELLPKVQSAVRTATSSLSTPVQLEAATQFVRSFQTKEIRDQLVDGMSDRAIKKLDDAAEKLDGVLRTTLVDNLVGSITGKEQTLLPKDVRLLQDLLGVNFNLPENAAPATVARVFFRNAADMVEARGQVVFNKSHRWFGE